MKNDETKVFDARTQEEIARANREMLDAMRGLPKQREGPETVMSGPDYFFKALGKLIRRNDE